MHIKKGISSGVRVNVLQFLDAAATTYVAALISAVTQLLHMITIVGGRNRRR